MIRTRSLTTGIALLLACIVNGCATPVGVTRLDERAANRQLATNVLSSGEPSEYSRQLLERTALAESFRKSPEETLAILHSGLGKSDEHDRLFALAELSYVHALADSKPSYYLASAVYAYAFLFPAAPADSPNPYDPRLTIALDLYNSGIAAGLTPPGGNEVDLSDRELALPFGTLELHSDSDRFLYGGHHLSNFVALGDYRVRGLRNTYRYAGIGAPLAAKVDPGSDKASRWIPPNAKVPITAIVRFENARMGMSTGKIRGALALYEYDETRKTEIGSDYSVPIEADPSTALAYRLEGAPIWDFELAGFRRGDFSLLNRNGNNDGLYMLHPYHPHLIPVVLVHGTASSPARWAEIANELLGDPIIASHYQIWLFMYNSGNPIALSGLKLRESLVSVREDVDPDDQDPALDEMVVVGHSQGGLLTKMLVVDSGTQFWDRLSRVPFAQAKLDPETRDLLRRGLFLKPLPFVTRVIFIATPHRGSYMASNPIVKFGNKFLNLPGSITKVAVQLATLRHTSMLGTPFTIPTALDNMDPSNMMLQTLAAMPIAPGVKANSIIAVKGNGPPEQGNDGVVKYQSAHLEGVESELVVRSGHSTQARPETIEEVRRILYEHAGVH